MDWVALVAFCFLVLLVLIYQFGKQRKGPAGTPADERVPSDGAATTSAGGAHAGSRRPSRGASDALDIAQGDFGPEDPTGPIALILVNAVGRTDAGRRRDHNEDSYLVLEEQTIFVVADGMGGYAAGEVASQLAIDVIEEAFRTATFPGQVNEKRPLRGDELVRAIEMANGAILTQARSNDAQMGMGTTLVAARFSPNRQRVYIAHVGDSRCYRLRDRGIRQMTSDHTLGALGIVGPASNKLSRAVGIEPVVEVDLVVDAPRPGDHYLLCSDGLSKMVPDRMICDLVLQDNDLERGVERLVDAANQRGGRDNVTVILIRVDRPVAA